MNTLTTFLLLVLIFCAGMGSYSLWHVTRQPHIPTAATMIETTRPSFSLYDIDNNLRNISEWDGKVLVLNFWATWCPPCLKEIPDLNRFHAHYHERGVEVIGIAHDAPINVRELQQTLSIQYPQLVDAMLAVELSRRYGNELGTLPYTVIIDREGIIRHIHNQGLVSYNDLEKLTQPLRAKESEARANETKARRPH